MGGVNREGSGRTKGGVCVGVGWGVNREGSGRTKVCVWGGGVNREGLRGGVWGGK